MSFVPSDELKEGSGFNFAPMIDFLFLMLAFFASVAVSKVSMQDTHIHLVKTKTTLPSTLNKTEVGCKILHISIQEDGSYSWITESAHHTMESASQISAELHRQHRKGLLPSEKSKTRVLLNIDKKAKWEPILEALVAIREAGFEVRPLFDTKKG